MHLAGRRWDTCDTWRHLGHLGTPGNTWEHMSDTWGQDQVLGPTDSYSRLTSVAKRINLIAKDLGTKNKAFVEAVPNLLNHVCR